MTELVLRNQHQNHFRKEIQNLFFYTTVWGMVVLRVRNKTSFVSLRFRFGGGNINIIQKKGERYFYVWAKVLLS